MDKPFFKFTKNTKPKTAYFSFDCQKEFALRRLPNQTAYFSRKINYSNESKDKLSLRNKFSYLWMEINGRKDSNTIVSIHCLNNFGFEPTPVWKKIWLFADGCSGQNKNANIMAILAYWLLEGLLEKDIGK